MPFLHWISSLEGTLIKICKIQPLDLLFLFVYTEEGWLVELGQERVA